MKFAISCRSLLFPVSALCLILFATATYAQDQSQTPVLELRLADTEPGEGLTKLEVEGGTAIYLHSDAVIREDDIHSVEAKEDDRLSQKVIHIRLTPAGGEKLSHASEANLNKPLAILFNGTLVSAPVIRSKLQRDIVINGDFTDAKIDEMLSAFKPRPRIPSLSKEDLDKFSKRLDRAQERKLVSGTVLLAVDGEIVFEKSIGYANVKEKTPFDTNSSFRLASISKQFTAMGIMLLKEDGKLDFNDDITKHLPKLPYKGVTIRHLLQHNGGLPDYMELFDKHWDKEADGSEKKTAFNQDLVDLFAKHQPKPAFAPGDRHQYSNTGYVLLGSIIESASGQSIQEFFAQKIFEPLYMTDSSAFSPNEKIFAPTNRVFGFQYLDDGHVEVDWHYLNGMVGDGGVYASARDMLKWDQALYGEQLVSRTTLDEAFTPGKLNDGTETDYGFGWMIEQSDNRGLTVSHGGSWVGFRTSIARHVDRKFTIIVLTNNSTNSLEQVLSAIDAL